MGALFLGLDASTQALKASLLSSDLSVLKEISIHFDRDLPHYGTQGGTLSGTDGSGIVYSPVMMLVEAIDLLFEKIKDAKWPVQDVRGISAAGQQHASVYWSYEASSILANIKADIPLSNQFHKAFSRDEIPNWQDSSTLLQCKQLEEAVGGPFNLAQLTGSKAHTRFTGPQIMRFKASQPGKYADTARISLVSSFITTMICLDGEIKNIDESDACGMNMWDMSTLQGGWNQEILEVIAGKEGCKDLEEKLGPVERDGGKVVGCIGQRFVQRYNFSPDCILCPGTGDNNATFLHFSLKPTEGLLSLGTSDTVLLSTSEYQPNPQYHVFVHPAQLIDSASKKRNYFNMLVYANGSLAREYIRDRYFNGSWDTFNNAVETSRQSRRKAIASEYGYWWLKPEIIPANANGIHKYSILGSITSADEAIKVNEFASESDNAIGILESQMLNYRHRSSIILGEGKQLSRAFATGGASSNLVICSVMADILGCEVCKPIAFDSNEQKWKDTNYNICSVAAGFKAAWAWHRTLDPTTTNVCFDDFIKHTRSSAHDHFAVVAKPDIKLAQAYSKSLQWWSALEIRALRESRKAEQTS